MTPSQTILHLKDRLVWDLIQVVFFLGLAGLTVWLDHHSHGEASWVAWAFGGVFALCSLIPVASIRRPKSRLLAVEGAHLFWRISEARSGKVQAEVRLPLSSIWALKWVVPKDSESRSGHDPSSARLLILSAQDRRDELPAEFWPAAHRKRIEAGIMKHVPKVQILEKLDGGE